MSIHGWIQTGPASYGEKCKCKSTRMKCSTCASDKPRYPHTDYFCLPSVMESGYDNIGAPGYVPPPPPAPQTNNIRGVGGKCLDVNAVCGNGGSTPCCSNFYCGEAFTDGVRRCERRSIADVPGWTPQSAPPPAPPAVPSKPNHLYVIFCRIAPNLWFCES